MTHSYVTWLIHAWTLSHSFANQPRFRLQSREDLRLWERYGSFICETWLIHMWRDSFVCGHWLIHTRFSRVSDRSVDMTHSYMRHDSYVRHDSFICETWLIHAWTLTHSYARTQFSRVLGRSVDMIYTCETWLIEMWNMTNHMWHDSIKCGHWIIHTLLSRVSDCSVDMTHSYVRHDSFMCRHY